MCWNKESSLIGFIINVVGLYLHWNSPSSKYTLLFITVSLTQLFDYLVHSNYNKEILGELLRYNFVLQLYGLKVALDLPDIYMLVVLFHLLYTKDWKPYVNNKNWNENKYTKYYLTLVWIIIPLFLMEKDNKKELFLLFSFILLHLGTLFKFGSVGKNWCINGVLLNILTKKIY